MVKSFHDLSEKEILALAISLEEEDGRIYGEFADRLKENFPSTASALEAMRQEESGHRHRLIELFQERFGENIPLIRRQDVKGFVHRPAIWLNPTVSPQRIRNQVQTMESETYRFYQQALARTTDAGTRKLLGDLAETEREHEHFASDEITKRAESGASASEDESARKLFVLQVVQPGLAGLMDGSVSTLAPVFAAAFATRNSWDAFL
ncbi:MAG TPA: ferritin family protein, partial [Chthoniobacterales bacterium]|nr:ferritin family protein [Chthoniobacterales bacterium]